MNKIELTKEQINISNIPKKGILVVKGTAGSGKTTVGISRLKFIYNRIMLDNDSVAFLTYNKTLISYVDYLISKDDNNLSDDGEGQFTIEHIIKENIDRSITTVSQVMIDYYFEYLKIHNLYLQDVSEDEKLYYLRKGILEIENEVQRKNISIFSRDNYMFLMEEIDWIRTCRIASEKDYQVIDRKGRIKTGGSSKRRLPKKSEVRQVIFRLTNKYIKLLWYDKKVDFIMKEMLALKQIQTTPIKRYEHIIVDEAQDLTKLQFDFLKHLIIESSNSTATFLYDDAQSIYPNSWLGPKRTFKSLGIKIDSSNSKKLKKNYRTTFEIQEAAFSMSESEALEKDFELIRRSNIKPVHYRATTIDEHNKYIISLVNSKIKTFGKKDIAITSRTKLGLKAMKKLLDDNGIDNEIVVKGRTNFEEQKVRLYTMHSIKGLESDIVIMAHMNEGFFPLKKAIESENGISFERKLMYVSMTRARYQLYMVSSTQHYTRFIDDIDYSLLDIQDDTTIQLIENERHPQLHDDYKYFEDFLKEIEDFKVKCDNKDYEVIPRRRKYSEIMKKYGLVEQRFGKVLDKVRIGGHDEVELTKLNDKITSILHYDNFSKYDQNDVIKDEGIYEAKKKKYLDFVKNNLRNLHIDSKDRLVDILINIEDFDSIKYKDRLYNDLFKILEIEIRNKFKNVTNGKYLPLSEIIGVYMNREGWRKIREEIREYRFDKIKSKITILNVRNRTTHEFHEVGDELLELKKLLIDNGLLSRILKAKKVKY